MELLGDVGHVESHFSPVGDSVSVSARQVHYWRQTYHRLRNHFGRNQWYSYATGLKWNLDLVRLEIVLILTQDRCTICVERTIGSQFILDALDGSPR